MEHSKASLKAEMSGWKAYSWVELLVASRDAL